MEARQGARERTGERVESGGVLGGSQDVDFWLLAFFFFLFRLLLFPCF